MRGNTYNVEVGFVLKIAREDLQSKLRVAAIKINK